MLLKRDGLEIKASKGKKWREGRREREKEGELQEGTYDQEQRLG